MGEERNIPCIVKNTSMRLVLGATHENLHIAQTLLQYSFQMTGHSNKYYTLPSHSGRGDIPSFQVRAGALGRQGWVLQAVGGLPGGAGSIERH